MKGNARFLARVIVGLFAAWLVGCSTTVSTSSGPVSDVRGKPGAPEEGDAARRAQVRLELASAYFSRNQMDVALEEVNRSIAADPTVGAAHNLRGLILGNLGQDSQAEESFRRALALNARDVDAMQNYGWFLCQHKRYGEADAQFTQALTIPQRRDTGRLLLTQGVCHAFSGQLEEAEKALMRSFQVDPGNPSTSVNLAEVLLRRGEPERARFHIRRVNSNPNYISAQTLWLAVRIEHKLGNQNGVTELGAQLRARYRESREAVAFERGQFNE
ncbi:type IV pilus biogenesis/stability protein PilW [Rhizobacter sp. AJA081-3]|jgi:type IV pilus assembly protein PilF|uniref:type IV pilus biogenesis/stability protein PilW n=1 Tax=Rhizobacter sp. AJA081-3 TaxID=2753607 RepID=UPI001ADF0CF8|nr:type IV pilus biogenesis/stability protein PilW [Rhizobacter sp. AJA081-3]QTN25380.1 type IV pilus biogenesis/stability protein PilW [Rhizobacter sp. AJA081-3]